MLVIEGKLKRRVLSASCENSQRQFHSGFFAGRKKLLKMVDVKFTTRVPNFKELSIERLLAVFPNQVEIRNYLSDPQPLVKINRDHCLNVP